MATSKSIPIGLCQCGCGQATAISQETRASIGSVKGQPNRYCRGHHRRVPLGVRLWRRVHKSDGCWLWSGPVNKQGYGFIGIEGNHNQGVHRVAYLLEVGPIGDGLCVCHKCDVPNCVNPQHLFLGTNADNVADRERKGRRLYRKLGAQNGRAKLSDDQVRAIYADARKQWDIARAYAISQATVHRIKACVGWAHLGLVPKRSFERRGKKAA